MKAYVLVYVGIYSFEQDQKDLIAASNSRAALEMKKVELQKQISPENWEKVGGYEIEEVEWVV